MLQIWPAGNSPWGYAEQVQQAYTCGGYLVHGHTLSHALQAFHSQHMQDLARPLRNRAPHCMLPLSGRHVLVRCNGRYASVP